MVTLPRLPRGIAGVAPQLRSQPVARSHLLRFQVSCGTQSPRKRTRKFAIAFCRTFRRTFLRASRKTFLRSTERLVPGICSNHAFSTARTDGLGKLAGSVCRATVRAPLGDPPVGCVPKSGNRLCRPFACGSSARAASHPSPRNCRDRPGSVRLRRTSISQTATARRLFRPGQAGGWAQAIARCYRRSRPIASHSIRPLVRRWRGRSGALSGTDLRLLPRSRTSARCATAQNARGN